MHTPPHPPHHPHPIRTVHYERPGLPTLLSGLMSRAVRVVWCGGTHRLCTDSVPSCVTYFPRSAFLSGAHRWPRSKRLFFVSSEKALHQMQRQLIQNNLLQCGRRWRKDWRAVGFTHTRTHARALVCTHTHMEAHALTRIHTHTHSHG